MNPAAPPQPPVPAPTQDSADNRRVLAVLRFLEVG